MRPAFLVRRMGLESPVSAEVGPPPIAGGGGAAVAGTVDDVAPLRSPRYASFEDFYEAEHVRLFRALVLVTGNRQETEDVLQEAFLRIWNRWDAVRDYENPAGYLYRTAVNISLSRRRRVAVAARSLGARLFAHDPLDTVDARDEIGRALARLTPRERAAVVLTDLLDLPAREAATAMGIRDSTVRVLSARGRERLRSMLGEAHE
jgi:RNA polymerase sigma-70 factor (ECF subfamily)